MERTDILLVNGQIADGTGGTPFPGSLSVTDGRISGIFTKQEKLPEARQIIDVGGRVIAPGFIDIHSHSDWSPFKEERCDSKILQGVTTEIVGNCGSSAVPNRKTEGEKADAAVFHSISEYAFSLNEKGMLNNFGMLTGHGTLRRAVMGDTDRRPEEEEMRELKELLRRELRAGAFGMSLGLIYPPSAFSETEELVELAGVLREEGGILAVHMRSEGERIFQAVDEVLEIAERSGVRLQISHLKLLGKNQWHQAEELLCKIRNARERGIRVCCDQYPFTASSTTMTALVPKEYHDGGRGQLLRRLKEQPEILPGIRSRIEERGGAETILISDASGVPEYDRRYLREIADQLGISPEEAVVKILLESGGNTQCIFFCICGEDMERIFREDYIAVGSDGTAQPLNPAGKTSLPHPRHFSTFPRAFSLARDKGLLPLGEVVRKCTGLPSEILGLRERGFLRQGFRADLTVFDPLRIGSGSQYTDSRVAPEGIYLVMIGGQTVVKENMICAPDAGRVLLRKKDE